MRNPISRVRSVTETSMMFMMPMPPTSSETEATAASSSDSTRLRRFLRLENLRQVADGEVVILRDRDLVPLAQQPRDLRLDLAHLALIAHFHRDLPHRADARPPATPDAVAERGQRHQDDVVLILAIGTLTLAREHADDREGDFAQPHLLSYGIAIPIQLARNGLPDYGDLGSTLQLPSSKMRPAPRAHSRTSKYSGVTP